MLDIVMISVLRIIRIFFLPLTHGAQDLKKLNLVRCETRNIVRVSDTKYRLKEDNHPLLHRSLDTKRTSLDQRCSG